jgi:hypothetical protein
LTLVDSTTVPAEPYTAIEVVTETSTSTSTAPQETETFSTTSTLYETVQTVVVEISTTTIVSEDVITLATTSTIPAPAGFTPIGTGNPLAKRTGRSKRQEPGATVTFHDVIICTSTTISTSTSVETATSTTTVTDEPLTTTSTSTTTVQTITVVLPAPASTTITSFDTSTLTETSTSTSVETTSVTTTSTIYDPVETFYAACGPDNTVSEYNGQFVWSLDWQFDDVNRGPSFSANSAYECCVACITSEGCAASLWDEFPATCNSWTPTDAQCQIERELIGFSVDPSLSGWTISNGLCGKFGFRE